jgi:hypothetical protein
MTVVTIIWVILGLLYLVFNHGAHMNDGEDE